MARLRLRKLACDVAARLAGVLRAAASDRDAIAVLNRLLQIDMADESAHRAVMELLARTGQRSEALHQYQLCAAALMRELGAEPGPETQRLLAGIKDNRLGAEAADSTVGIVSGNAAGTAPRSPLQTSSTVLYAEVARGDRPHEDDASRLRSLGYPVDAIASRIDAHHGQCVRQSGDSLLAQFGEPTDALTCALTVQRELEEANRVRDRFDRVHFRIGIDEGPVRPAHGDLSGDGISGAIRLEALAEPGGICISDAVRAAVRDSVDVDCLFVGEQPTSQTAEPVRVYRVTELSRGIDAEAAGKGHDRAPSLSLPGKPSLITKPFSNMSPDVEQDYFSEGLTKDISIALTKIPGLFLAADETPTARVSQGLSATQLGREFGVRYVLSGSVRRHGDQVRVSAELIDAATGQCLWGERFDRELHDLFSIQDEITEEIVTAMDVKLVQGEGARFMRKALTKPAALDASYRAWYALYHGGCKQDVHEAQRLFEEVIRLEPESPLGYASAALAYWAEAGFGRVVKGSSAMAHAAELARQALAPGDTTGYAHLIMALVHLANRAYEEAMAQATEGVAARPSCNGAFAIKSSVLNFLGRPGEAIEFAQYAVRLTPVYPAEFPAVLAAAYHDSGRYDEAVAAAEASLRLRQDDIDPLLILAASQVGRGDLVAARGVAARGVAAKVQDLDRSFHLAEFAETQPYRNPLDLERLLGRLREAGLPG